MSVALRKNLISWWSLDAEWNGTRYRRSRGIGPEDRNVAWHAITEVS